MLETQILGPLNTPYYYAEVSSFLDIAEDGTFALNASTVRLADITIRDEPDNQIYIRTFVLSGTIASGTNDAVITGTVNGTDQLWSGDSETEIGPVEATGELTVLCDNNEESGFAIFGFAGGNGVLEFEARP